MTHSRRAIRLMLATAAILTIIALTVGIRAYQDNDLRRIGGAVSLQVAAICITWLAQRRPAPTVKQLKVDDEVLTPDGSGFVTRVGEKAVDVWVTRIARNRTYPATFVKPKAEFGTWPVAVVEPEDTDVFAERVTCETADSHYFPSADEMGIDAESVGWKYYPCACGKQYDGRYDHEKN